MHRRISFARRVAPPRLSLSDRIGGMDRIAPPARKATAVTHYSLSAPAV
jgi:hypothetical protein